MNKPVYLRGSVKLLKELEIETERLEFESSSATHWQCDLG